MLSPEKISKYPAGAVSFVSEMLNVTVQDIIDSFVSCGQEK